MDEKYDVPCREVVTRERLYEKINDAIKNAETLIIREESRLDTLKLIKRNLDQYFEDLDRKVR